MNYTLGETLLCLDKVELGYGNGSDYKAVLKDINIVEKDVLFQDENMGQVIAILGRSGRGKSTLLKALAGLTHPKNGQVLIKNMQVETVNTAKIVGEGDVGFVDQKYTLFRHKTVDQILNYACRKKKLNDTERKDLIEKYLADWGLTQHRKKYPCDLSGGQRQRVAIIEQMLSSGHFIILDEPFSGLDVGNIREVKKSFNKIQKADSLNTIIFSTHDLNLAVELADSIYIVGFADESQSHATVVKHFDLKQSGLAWKEQGEGHRQLVKEIDEAMMKS